MAELVAISVEEFKSYSWKKAVDLNFARGNTLCLLGAQEIIKASVSLPVAFFAVNGSFVPVALQGTGESENLFINDKGRWLGEYLPEYYRCYPFFLVKSAEDKYTLCFDKASGCLIEAEGGEPFFGEDGEMAERVSAIFAELQKTEMDRLLAEKICEQLTSHDLITPWPLAVEGEKGQARIEGIYRIDEEKLNQLDGSALMELRDSGALIAAYAQMFSMQKINVLGRLAHRKDILEKTTQKKSDEYSMGSESATLSFDNL